MKKSDQIWVHVAKWSSLPLLLIVWEIVVRAGTVNAVLFPPPSVVAVSMVEYAASGTLVTDLGWSVSRVLVGYLAGATAAILVGILTGGNKLAAAFFSPVFPMLRPLPPTPSVPDVLI